MGKGVKNNGTPWLLLNSRACFLWTREDLLAPLLLYMTDGMVGWEGKEKKEEGSRGVPKMSRDPPIQKRDSRFHFCVRRKTIFMKSLNPWATCGKYLASPTLA